MKTSESTGFQFACERYSDVGVRVESALETLARTPLSIHCWQGDDVSGFEHVGELGGGLAATGKYPGKARNADELRRDFEQAQACIPGPLRFNLHSIYAEPSARVERDAIEPAHFQRWIDWAAERKLSLDFNPSYFAHPMADSGFTLAHPDPAVRDFWVRHGMACRRIAAAMGRAQGSACMINHWMPDGYKDTPVDRRAPRERMMASLDRVLAETPDPAHVTDALESKLFGIGVESYTVASHEFCLGFAASRRLYLCYDAGHFHPTETIADKISASLLYVPGLLLHLSRGVRWDSDHVATLSDDLQAICQDVVRGDALLRVAFSLDYFDASINRIAAWIIGARNVRKALLAALLEPHKAMREAEQSGDFTARLACMEENRLLPLGAVWDEFCRRQGIPEDGRWLPLVRKYESDVLATRR